jgi:Transposase DDE domain
MNPEARKAFNTLHNLISSPDIQNSFDTLLHAFLNADGNPRPQTATAKSSSAISRMLNHYALPALALLRESRAIIQQRLQAIVLNSKKRRPTLELMIDLTTLEKTGAFEGLPLSFFNDKYGLHLVVLYIVVGEQRFIWAIRIWRGKGERSWVELALSMLRCLPAWLTSRFKCRVLADAGFGSSAFITGCAKLKLPVVVGVSCDRTTEEGIKLSALPVQGAMLFLKGCVVPVYVAWFKLIGKNGAYEWRYVVSTVAAHPRTIVCWGRRRWQVEAFFKTMKSRFGLDQFGQRTLKGVLRFFLLAFIAYLLVFWSWSSQPMNGFEIPDWIELARDAQVWLVTWVVQFELDALQAQVDQVIKLKVAMNA